MMITLSLLYYILYRMLLLSGTKKYDCLQCATTYVKGIIWDIVYYINTLAPLTMIE